MSSRPLMRKGYPVGKVHFVGVTPRQYWSAMRVWGTPDSVYPSATWSVMGDIPGEDDVVLGEQAFPIPRKWKGRKRLPLTAHGYLKE